jgi:diacylglycerol kinase family enzyme
MPSQRAQLLDAFAPHDRVQVDVVESSGDELAAAAGQALAMARGGRLDAIVVGGGDGSVGTVAGVLAGTGVPLGVLPLGTLNHFAKDLGIPTDLAGAVAVIAAGQTRDVDIAEVNGKPFVNNSSIGLYPHMVIHRDRQTRLLGIGKPLATLLASLHTLQRFPRRRSGPGAGAGRPGVRGPYCRKNQVRFLPS